jgi:hypothetical protein
MQMHLVLINGTQLMCLIINMTKSKYWISNDLNSSYCILDQYERSLTSKLTIPYASSNLYLNKVVLLNDIITDQIKITQYTDLRLGIQEDSSVSVLAGKAERELQWALQQCISSQFSVQICRQASSTQSHLKQKENRNTQTPLTGWR